MTAYMPTVSIITSTCYEHGLVFMNLFNAIKQQNYKNIKEWVIYNYTSNENQADFAKFFAKFERKYYLDIGNQIELKIINNDSAYRVENRENCNVLNDLVEASSGEIIVIMNDRDQYTPIRVTSAVNALRTRDVAFNEYQLFYSLDKLQDYLFTIDQFGQNCCASSLAFRKSIMNEDMKFDGIDSMYDFVYNFSDEYGEEQIAKITDSMSYAVYKTFQVSESKFKYVSKSLISFTQMRRIANTKKIMDSLMSNRSHVCKAAVSDECPVCFSETDLCFKLCKHTICMNCVNMLTTHSCPMCRNEFKSHFGIWNMEYWEEDEDYELTIETDEDAEDAEDDEWTIDTILDEVDDDVYEIEDEPITT